MSLPAHFSPIDQLDQRVDHPDYSYLDNLGPVAPQPLDHEAYVFDHGPDANVIPLLDESDGLHIGLDGKLHLSPSDAVDSAELHAPTGAFVAREMHHPEPSEKLAVEPMAVAPATFAVHGLGNAVGGLYRSRFTDTSRPIGLHRR